jgi:ubiquinone/menaquinone biosynthesis C-methylase UbiE
MSEEIQNINEEIRLWQEKLYKRSIRRKRKVERLRGLVGQSMNLQCLEISAGDGIISTNLRELGGSWKTAVTTTSASDSLGYSTSENIALIDNGQLPYEDGVFDRVVIVDALKGIAEDYDFLHECHRVLKNDGWVIISEDRRAPASLVALLQRIFGTAPIAKGLRRNGYTGNELFNILKDGYDVPETITYSNGLFEAAAAIGDAVQKSILKDHYWMVRASTSQEELYRYEKLHMLAGISYPILWLLSRLEFLPGHKLLVKSRRRHWRPRLSPKLVDGRSIAEAAINTKIGTAAPF